MAISRTTARRTNVVNGKRTLGRLGVLFKSTVAQCGRKPAACFESPSGLFERRHYRPTPTGAKGSNDERNQRLHRFRSEEQRRCAFHEGHPRLPQCGFSGQVVQILDYVGVDYKGVNVLTSNELRQGIKDYSNWPTIPSSM
jgi:glutaredoxin-related protein